MDGEPSLKDKVASFSAITFSGLSACALQARVRCRLTDDQREHRPFVRIAALAAPHDQVEQLGVGSHEEPVESIELGVVEMVEVSVQKARQHEIELEHTAPAAPAYAIAFPCTQLRAPGHRARFTIRSRILLMAAVGLRPLGTRPRSS